MCVCVCVCVYLKHNSREISFTHNLFLSYQIVSICCTEHGTMNVTLCAKFQTDLRTEMDVMDEFKRSFGWISYIETAPDAYIW